MTRTERDRQGHNGTGEDDGRQAQGGENMTEAYEGGGVGEERERRGKEGRGDVRK